ncbi:MAG: hypothetical protein AB7P34_06585 [Vicinamibacterales bacterium]
MQRISSVLCGLSLVCAMPVLVRAQAPAVPYSDVTKAEIEAVVKAPDGGGDRQIKVMDIGKLNVGVGVLHRDAIKDAGSGPVRGISHTLVTEVYYIISGSGTLVTGGTVMSPQPMAADAEVVRVAVGPSITGAVQQGGVTRVVSAGDVIVIPAGTFHGWKVVPDHVTYLSVRPDPDRVLPVGYLNPALKK